MRFLTLLAILSLFPACNDKHGESVKVVSPKDFAQKINETPNPQIVDVRTAEEFAEKHIDNAYNVDWYENNLGEKTTKLDKSKPVFVYCMAGGRSRKAAAKLAQLGFSQVYDLKGGIVGWNGAGLTKQPDTAGMSIGEYHSLLSSGPNVLVHFYTRWSGPSKKIAPLLERIAAEHNDIKIVGLNADEQRTLVSALKIDSLPTLLLYKNGKVSWRQAGIISAEDLKKQLP